MTPGQPHVLAINAPRSQSLRVKLSLATTNLSTKFYVYPTNKDSDVKTGPNHAEYTVLDDKKAPIFVIFENLYGIHRCNAEYSLKTSDGKVHTESGYFFVQRSTIGESTFYNELVQRLMYKINHRIEENLLFTGSRSQMESTLFWQIRAFTKRTNNFRPGPFNFDEIAKLVKQDVFIASKDKLAALTAVLIELTNPDALTHRKIEHFIYFKTADMDHLDVEPSNVQSCFEQFYKIDLREPQLRQVGKKNKNSHEEKSGNLAEPSAAAKTPFKTPRKVTTSPRLRRTDSSTIAPGLPLPKRLNMDLYMDNIHLERATSDNEEKPDIRSPKSKS